MGTSEGRRALLRLSERRRSDTQAEVGGWGGCVCELCGIGPERMWHRQLFGGGKLCGAELQGMWHRQLFGKGVCVWICVAQNSKVCGTGNCLEGGGVRV